MRHLSRHQLQPPQIRGVEATPESQDSGWSSTESWQGAEQLPSKSAMQLPQAYAWQTEPQQHRGKSWASKLQPDLLSNHQPAKVPPTHGTTSQWHQDADLQPVHSEPEELDSTSETLFRSQPAKLPAASWTAPAWESSHSCLDLQDELQQPSSDAPCSPSDGPSGSSSPSSALLSEQDAAVWHGRQADALESDAGFAFDHPQSHLQRVPPSDSVDALEHSEETAYTPTRRASWAAPQQRQSTGEVSQQAAARPSQAARDSASSQPEPRWPPASMPVQESPSSSCSSSRELKQPHTRSTAALPAGRTVTDASAADMHKECSTYSESDPHDQPEEAAVHAVQPAEEHIAAPSRPDMQRDTSMPQAGAGQSAQSDAQSQQLGAAPSRQISARLKGYWWTPGLDDDGGDMPPMQHHAQGEVDCKNQLWDAPP